MSLQAFIIVVIQVFSMQFLIAERLSGQSLKDTKLTEEITEKRLVEVFKIIERKTSYAFAFPEEIKNDTRKFDFSFRNRSLDKALIEICGKAHLTFKVIDYTISVAPSKTVEPAKTVKQSTPVPIAVAVSGTVTDEEGSPLPGVNIIIKGTSFARYRNICKSANWSTLYLKSASSVVSDVLADSLQLQAMLERISRKSSFLIESGSKFA